MDIPPPDKLDYDFLKQGAPTLSAWYDLTAHLPSPTTFKTVGFLFWVSAALQRRVWIGNLQSHPIFPNIFAVMAGPSAVGKTFVTNMASRLLSIPRKGKREAVVSGPDSMTFEQLVDSISKATQATDYMVNDAAYIYHSMYLSLQEIETLFKEKAESTTKFLLCAWDGDKFRYETKHQNQYDIKNISVAILGGGVTREVLKLTRSSLMTDGFVARTMFIFDNTPSNTDYEIPTLTPTQQSIYQNLGIKTGELAKSLGSYHIHGDDINWLSARWQSTYLPNSLNESCAIASFYGRFRQHIPKLALLFHRAESTDHVLSSNSIRKATHVVEFVAGNMLKHFSGGEVAGAGKGKITQTPATSPSEAILMMVNEEPSKSITWTAMQQRLVLQGITPEDGKLGIRLLLARGRLRIDGQTLFAASSAAETPDQPCVEQPVA